MGLATALLLARWEVPSIVLEEQPRRDPIGSKAICVQRDVLDILDRIGCADTMMAQGVTWWRGRTFYREHELVQVSFPELGRSAFPPFINIPQSTTEHCLAMQIVVSPAVEMRLGHRVVGLVQEADSVSVEVETATGREQLTGSHLVAADGGRSTVRRLLGLSFDGHSFDDQFLIADIRASLPFSNERRFFFDPPWNPGRQVLVHPQPDSVWRIDWQVPGDFDLTAETASGALDRRIRQITGEQPYETVWVSAYRFHQRLASAFRVGRTLLAGDAAHLMSPFGARGLNSGLQDAENAAWKLAFVRHGWAGEGLLGSYDAERRAAAQENLRVTEATMHFLVPQNESAWSRRREVLERSVVDPNGRHLVDSGRLAEPFWYVDSPLTTPAGDLSAFPREAGCSRPPLPGVLCPDGPCRVAGRPEVSRLRQLFGRGFVVLVSRPGDAQTVERTCAAAAAAPVTVLVLDDIDSEAVLRTALDAQPAAALLVRPDGHIAAVVGADDSERLAGALRRCLGDAH